MNVSKVTLIDPKHERSIIIIIRVARALFMTTTPDVFYCFHTVRRRNDDGLTRG